MSPEPLIQDLQGIDPYSPAPGEFRMAWFCPLVVEEQAAAAALTTEYAVDKDDYLQMYKLKGDRNIYTLGKIKNYKIVICRPSDTRGGPVTAAMAWRDLQRSFPNIEHFLIVGIAGGVPNIHNKPDVRLGDVVIGLQDKAHPGMIQIDAGWQKQSFESTINICPPPAQLQVFAERLINWPNERHSKRAGQFKEISDGLLAKLGWVYPGVTMDYCFQANSKCRNSETCPDACRKHCRQIDRPPRDSGLQRIHGGLICSSSKVIKDAKYRDQAVAINNRDGKAQILAFETEGYGIASQVQCLNIRGVSDYADAHKNSRWQPYAAVNAVAAAKIITQLLIEQSSESHVLGSDQDCGSSSSICVQQTVPRNIENRPGSAKHTILSVFPGIFPMHSDEEAVSQHKKHTQVHLIQSERLLSSLDLDSNSLKQFVSQVSSNLQDIQQQSSRIGSLPEILFRVQSSEMGRADPYSKMDILAPSGCNSAHTVCNGIGLASAPGVASSPANTTSSQYIEP